MLVQILTPDEPVKKLTSGFGEAPSQAAVSGKLTTDDLAPLRIRRGSALRISRFDAVTDGKR